MALPSETQFLPVAPSDLCFDKNEFIKTSFSADQFLQSHRRKANLEVLRDDLGVYLKVLRSAMIELINKDYADFVNLSSNLIGLDKAINGIQVPLGQLKEEILQVKFNLDEAMNELSNSLNARRKLQAQKYSLQRLARVQCSLSKLRNLLYNDSKQCAEEIDQADKVKGTQLDAALMERAASEYNQLQFCIFKCENDVAATVKEDAKKILDFLSTSLDGMFLRCFLARDDEGIIRCLRIYVTLDKIADAEALLRKEVVLPALHNIVSESSLQADPRGLQGVYARVLDFIDTNMEQLLKLTADSRRTQIVKGFDFLVNSLWPELEEHLELHLSSIYAPGNPEMFHQRYCETLEFLTKLEQYCGTQAAVEKLRSHPQFKAFLQRWNLPVYFQIRFQEIAGLLESAMYEGNPADTTNGSSSLGFHLRITTVTWNCLLRCWEEGVFLMQLTHRFWKLSLQIVARYYTWIGKVLEEKWPAENMQPVSSASTYDTAEITCSIRLQFLVHLYSDVQQLVSKLPYLLDLALKKLPSLSQQGQSLLKKSLNESEQQLTSRLSLVTHFILGEVSGQSLPHLRQVNDIPRLFRRTNREMPVKPCAYVASLLAAPVMFHRTQREIVNPELLEQWLTLVFSAVTQQFFGAVDDVLVSVQKTEESLRRLKKIRDRTATTSTSEAKGIGDDDKIRHQLLLDVYSYCEGIESVGISRAKVDRLDELIRLVEAAKDRSEINK